MKKKYPVVDTGRCTLCGGCIEVAPAIFRYNRELGFVEVVECSEYPERIVEEAIILCPVDCIFWEDC